MRMKVGGKIISIILEKLDKITTTKKDKQKFNSIDNLDNLEIKFWVGSYMGGSMWFRLNRINGKIFSLAGDGQCYKGFKEYEKQI